MDELDFTIEMTSDLTDKELERALMAEAESELRKLASGHSDIRGAAVTVRQPGKKETPPLHEATVVVYARPENVVGKEKQDTPSGALKGALDAVEKQIRRKREMLREHWEQPQNDPVTREVLEVAAAEEEISEEMAEQDEAAGSEGNV